MFVLAIVILLELVDESLWLFLVAHCENIVDAHTDAHVLRLVVEHTRHTQRILETYSV